MKKLSPTFLIAASIVTISLFVLLSMLFYGPSDYLEQGSAERDSPYYGFRYTVASAFFGSFGIGAYMGWMIILAWAVIVFFRESVGDLAIRGISLAVVVVSGAALADLLGSNYLGGSLGYAVGTVLRSGFGTVLGVILIGLIFSVSLILATDFGFVSYYKEARGALAVAERDEEEEAVEAPMDLISRIEQTVHEIESEEEPSDADDDDEQDGVEAQAELDVEIQAPEANEQDAGNQYADDQYDRPIVIDLRPVIEEEELDEELATSEESLAETPMQPLTSVTGPIIETEPNVELAGPETDVEEEEEEEIEATNDAQILLETMIEAAESHASAEDFVVEAETIEAEPIEEAEVEAGEMEAVEMEVPAEAEPEASRSAEEALESVFDALVGPSEMDSREEELMRSAMIVIDEGGMVVAEPEEEAVAVETKVAEIEAPEAEEEEPVEAEAEVEEAVVEAQEIGEPVAEVEESTAPILDDPVLEELQEEEATVLEDRVFAEVGIEEAPAETTVTEETTATEETKVEEPEAPTPEPVAEVEAEVEEQPSEPQFVLDDAVYIVDESIVAEEEPEVVAPQAEAIVAEEIRVEREEPVAEPEPEPVQEQQQVILLDDEVTLRSDADEEEDTLLPFMQEEDAQPIPEAAASEADAPEAPEATADEEPVEPQDATEREPVETREASEIEPEPDIPVLEEIEDKGMFRSLFTRKQAPRTAAVADPLLDHAAEMVIERGRASVVLLQRRLDVGYTRAARIIEALEAEGLVGPMTEAGSREILLTLEGWRERTQ